MSKIITKHHIIPKSMGGSNHTHNIEKKTQNMHRAHHLLYDNQVPHEQLLTIIDLTGKAFNRAFAEDIKSVIYDYNIEDVYTKQCVNIEKLIRAILDSKQ